MIISNLTGLDWITALRAPAIRALLDRGALQLSLFDQRDMASITAPDFPNQLMTAKFGFPPLEEGCLRSSHNNRQ
jgi:hypothetical protein